MNYSLETNMHLVEYYLAAVARGTGQLRNQRRLMRRTSMAVEILRQVVVMTLNVASVRVNLDRAGEEGNPFLKLRRQGVLDEFTET